jgi:hypothetical protein
MPGSLACSTSATATRAGQCRMLTLELSDGTTLTADFKFTN